jgi:hypothetical protein
LKCCVRGASAFTYRDRFLASDLGRVSPIEICGQFIATTGFVVLGIALMIDAKKENQPADSEGVQKLRDPNIAPQTKTNWSSLAADRKL